VESPCYSFVLPFPSVRRCNELRLKIAGLTEGEYAVSKQEVDRLRQELGQPPLPSLQATLEEKSSQCVIRHFAFFPSFSFSFFWVV
jgi:hypothetical protein